MRLKQVRKATGMTQADLALAVGVQQNTISQWENGERLVRSDKLPKLAQVLGCTIDALFEGAQTSSADEIER